MPSTEPPGPLPFERPGHLARAVIVLLVLLACLVRLVHLDADPRFPTWVSYIVDEGRWIESARNLALFGTTDAFAERIHLILSPAYQASSYVSFRLFGIGFGSARLTSAIAGILLVVATWAALRRNLSTFAMAFGVLILGFETNMLAQSRTALPELPSVLGSLLAFLVLLVGRQNRRNAFVAGLLVALSVAMKGTSVLVVPVFPLMILLDRRSTEAPRPLVRCAAFLSGFAAPLIAGMVIAVAIGLVGVHHLDRMLPRFLSFLSLASPGVVIWQVFESSAHEGRNLMLLAAWLCSWLWMHRGPNAPVVARTLYWTSGLWAAWWLMIWLANAYSPGRYVVHFIVPATLHVMAGLTLADRDTLGRIERGLLGGSAMSRGARLLWLAAPTSLLLVSILVALAPSAGWDFSRVGLRVAAIVALAALMALALWRRPPNRAACATLLIAPVVSLLLWLVGREFGVFRHFWSVEGTAGATWMVTVGLCYVATYWLASARPAVHDHPAARVAVLALVAAPLIVQAAAPVAAPTFSIRDASRDLALRYGCATEFRAMSAASLFLETPLRYRELTRNELNHDERRYDVLVVFEHNGLSRRFLSGAGAAELGRLGAYPLLVHPRYQYDVARDGPMEVSVYAPRSTPRKECAPAQPTSAQRD